MDAIRAEQILNEWEVEGDQLVSTCAIGHPGEDLCPRCFNEVVPDVQGHCPICDYCMYCEI